MAEVWGRKFLKSRLIYVTYFSQDGVKNPSGGLPEHPTDPRGRERAFLRHIAAVLRAAGLWLRWLNRTGTDPSGVCG